MSLTGRDFLATGANGLGGLALASLLNADRLLAAEAARSESAAVNPQASKPPHFAPKATGCIYIFMEGGTSQIDLFDPKPKLNELHGQKMPESLTKNVRFAFIQKDSAVLLGSPHKFRRYGQCGMELSEMLPGVGGCADDLALVPSMHTQAFNHHPCELLMYTGTQNFGRPSVGSWINYALGSPSQNLPGYVVLTAGRAPTGRDALVGNGVLPSAVRGVRGHHPGAALEAPGGPPSLA